MGFRYAVITFESPAADPVEVMCEQLSLSLTRRDDAVPISLPDKLADDKLWRVDIGNGVAIVAPYRLLQLAGHDIASIAAATGGTVTGVAVEDTAGESWYQLFENGECLAAYYCGDGTVVTADGELPDITSQDWDERALFDLLPETVSLDANGSWEATAAAFSIAVTPIAAQDKPWWKLW